MKAHPPAAANMQGYGRIRRWLATRGDIDAVRALPERLEALNLGRCDSTPAFSRTVLALVDNDPVRARNEAVAAVTIDTACRCGNWRAMCSWPPETRGRR